MPITMTDHYSEDTQGARVCLEKAFDLVRNGLQQTAGSGRFGFADYGAADGGTAEALYRMVAESVRGRSPVVVVLNDLPGNDAQTLNRFGKQTFASVDARVLLSMDSFYRPVVEPDSVDLGFSATAMHWLSEAPPVIDDHTHANACPDPEVRETFARLAAKDWEQLLLRRAEELRPGGQLVMVNLARDGAGHYLGANGRDHNMHDVLHEIWLGLHQEGRFSREAYRAATFQNFYKSPDEFRAPFDREGPVVKAGLRLAEMRTESTPCFYRAAHQEHGDPERFAEGLKRTVRSWSRHTFSTALHDHPEGEELVEELYRRFAARVRAEPERFSMDYVHNLMRVEKVR